mmetsp:Transcript_20340/g.52757  ORF Transcript_20340/g.52757 Transcript_20340/m.52757 type:complete len:212 (+) Transcript_20340:202-837(+)
MGCGSSKSNGVVSLEGKGDAKLNPKPKFASTGATERVTPKLSHDDVEAEDISDLSDTGARSPPRKKSSVTSLHEQNMILSDWRAGTEDALHKRIHAARASSPEVEGSASVSAAPRVARRKRSPPKSMAAHQPQQPWGGDEADDESSDEDLPIQRHRVVAKKGREPTLPGAVWDDEPTTKPTAAKRSPSTAATQPSLLTMFRPKSALNLDLD